MKKVLLLIICILLLIPAIIYAHPGQTDSDGGHYDKTTGKYHYHHGYSSHQHTNNECPYDFNDKTDHSSSNESISSFTNKTTKQSYFERDPFGFFISIIIFGTVLIAYIIPMLNVFIDEIIYKWKNRKK